MFLLTYMMLLDTLPYQGKSEETRCCSFLPQSNENFPFLMEKGTLHLTLFLLLPAVQTFTYPRGKKNKNKNKMEVAHLSTLSYPSYFGSCLVCYWDVDADVAV